MSINIEVINHENHQYYYRIADAINEQLLLKEGYISLGMKKDNQAIGLLIAEVSGDKAVILFMKVQSEQEGQLLSAFVQVLEKVLNTNQVKYLFCFHPNTETLTHAFQLANWTSSINQYEYVITAKQPKIYSLPLPFQIAECSRTNLEQLYEKEIFTQDALPPFEVVNTANSYLLIENDQPIGWFITVIQPHSNVLSIARFYMEKEFRDVKITIPFFNNALYHSYKKTPYDTIFGNVAASHKKAIKIIDKGYLGNVKEKKAVIRSYKIMR